MSSLEVACSLMPAELQARRRNLLSRLRSAVSEVTELNDGFSYRFASDALLPEIGALIQLEHQCCPFLTFGLTVESGAGAVLLEMTGPEGTKAFLADVFC